MSAQPFRSSTFAASGWARRLRPVAVAVSLALVAETAAAAEAHRGAARHRRCARRPVRSGCGSRS